MHWKNSSSRKWWHLWTLRSIIYVPFALFKSNEQDFFMRRIFYLKKWAWANLRICIYGYNGLVWFGRPFFYGPDQCSIPTWVGCQAGSWSMGIIDQGTLPPSQPKPPPLWKIQNVIKKLLHSPSPWQSWQWSRYWEIESNARGAAA